MAFVYSQPRWSPHKNNQTPGPGSHSPDLIKEYNFKIESNDKGKIRKGKSFLNALNKSQNNYQPNQPQPFHNNNIYSVESVSKMNRNTKKLTKQSQYIRSKDKIKNIDKVQGLQTQTLQIKSIGGGKIVYLQANSNRKKKSQKTEKTQQQWDLQDIMMKKTNPSIKETYCENFYIGSKQQYDKSSIKNANPNLKRKKLNRLNQRACERFKNYQSQQIIKSAQNTQRIQYENRVQLVKPISAQHPFRRKQQLFQPQNSKYQEKSTGIQQQDSQFVADAVPGPGSYDVQFSQQTTKKCMMFTDKNRDRFQNSLNSHGMSYEFIYDHKPKTCKSVSRASQARVAFGSALNATYKYQKKQECQTDYYQIFQNIQNKSTKIKLIDALNPGFFTSKVPRFSYLNKQKKFIRKDQVNEQISLRKTINCQKQNKITHPFNSAVTRCDEKQHLTAKIDFNGQKYKTIQQNIQNINNHPHYNQNMDLEQDNDYRGSLQMQKRVKSDIEIKNQLIQDIYGFRQRENKKKRKNEIKAYSFSPKQQRIINKQNNPSPTDYYKEKDWIKSTFNQKFIEGEFYKRGHIQKDQITKDNQIKRSQQLKLLRI